MPCRPTLRNHLAAASLALAASLGTTPGRLAAQPPATASDATILEAREALRKRDRNRLAAARAAAQAGGHPLAPWVDYWDLSSRLNTATLDEVEGFYARWAGTYVEDRLRNDWLLELGRRRDWDALARDYPRFRMNDDREVLCYWLLTEHLAGRDVRDAAREAWFAQRDVDDGCSMLATAMVDAKRFSADDVWRRARLAVEANRPGAARFAVGLLSASLGHSVAQALESPARYLRRSGEVGTRSQQELRLLAVIRLAASDPEGAASQLDAGGRGSLTPTLAAWGWASTGRQAAVRLSADAPSYYHRAWKLLGADELRSPGWSDDTLAWAVRSALRVTRASDRWAAVLRGIEAMSPAEQANPTWVYWRAKALAGTARSGAAGDEQRAEATRLLESIASPLGFYPQLAAEELGQPRAIPPAAAETTRAEREAAAVTPGLARALRLTAIGLRDEARREWNFTLRGMSDRELIAAARLACEYADWQICINTSDRTKAEIDVPTRYPTPYATEIRDAARSAGLDPAYVFGVIRQETRFMATLRSSAGATGLMQLMPGTARWVAKKTGTELPRPDQVYDPAVNLRLGTAYLRLVLDDLDGSQALAAAAYNAGPGRPRRWREGPTLDAAAWAENVPFGETRDYVKRVLSNAAVYSAQLNGQTPVLRPRLGQTIGPRDASASPVNTELP